jgi:hypothetical protein
MPRNEVRIAVSAALLIGGLLGGRVVSQAGADHLPADKVVASGSALEVLGPEVTEGSESLEATLLTGRLRSSSPTDLLFSVTAECALWTNIVVVGNNASEAVATVKIWVELDGTPVPVAANDSTETGKVVFCNRAFRQEIENLDDEDAIFRTFIRTRAANAFNWALLNVGPGVHSIEVKARLESEVEGTGTAMAAVGKRTLTVDPVKMANDASI